MRWLNGGEVTDRLGIPHPPRVYKVLVGMQCGVFMLTTYARRAGVFRFFEGTEGKQVARTRERLKAITLKEMDGEETALGMWWVPELGKGAQAGKVDAKEGLAGRRLLVGLMLVVGAWLLCRGCVAGLWWR